MLIRVTLLWVFTAVHLIRGRRRLIRLSVADGNCSVFMGPGSLLGRQPLSYLLEGQHGLTHRKFLQITEENWCLHHSQVLLDLIPTSQEGLVEDVEVETVLDIVTMR